jgi:hypothetical protein
MVDEGTSRLVDTWGEENVKQAFWLSNHIKEHGLDGIEYMEAARNHLHSTGEFTVRQKMDSQMNKKY